MYENPRPPYPNELYHHGVLGMHWGIRRYQPYRKGDQVKGGKEVGKATKVEQRSIADRVKKGIAAVNKIKKELHKGNLEKEQYKYERAQLKEAQREVKKAKRRKAEENIRERIRERREQEREDRRLEEERRDRNLERARDIAGSVAQIGTMVYGAYQLKKNFDAARGLNNDTSTPQQTNSTPSSTSSTPNVSTSGTGSHQSTSTNPASSTGTSSAGPTRQHRIRDALQSVQNSHQANQSLNSYDATSNQRLSQNIQNATANSNRYSDAQTSIRQAIRRIDPHADFDSNGNYRSTSRSSVSDEARTRIQRLEQINDLMDTERQRAQNLAGALGSVQATYQQNQSGAGRQRRYRDKQERIKNIAAAAGMTPEQYKNASKKDQLKALAKFMTQSGSAQAQANANSDAEFMNQMRRMDNLRSHMSEDERKRLMREIEQLSHMNRYSDELYHHGVLGMHWGIRRFQPYRKGERVKGGKEVGKATKVEQRESLSSKILRLTNKTERTWAKQKKADAERVKNGFYDTESDEYKNEKNRVRNGGVNKDVDAARKKYNDAVDKYNKTHAWKDYLAVNTAADNYTDATNKYMKNTGIKQYKKSSIEYHMQLAAPKIKDAQKVYDKAKEVFHKTDPNSKKYIERRRAMYLAEIKLNRAKEDYNYWNNIYKNNSQ